MVRKNALGIVKILQLEKSVDKNLLQAICLLHDLCYSVRKPGLITWLREIKYTKQELTKVLPSFNLNASDSYILQEAIYKHKGPFPFRRLNKQFSIYSQILQDADSLEFINRTRLANFLSFLNTNQNSTDSYL